MLNLDWKKYENIISMEITKLSSQGQVTIPQILRDRYHWEAGQELIIINLGDGILLKPKKTFTETKLDDVAGCLKYQGKAKTIEEMEQLLARGIKELWNQSDVQSSSI